MFQSSIDNKKESDGNSTISAINQQLEAILEDPVFNEYLKILSQNNLVIDLKKLITSISDETVIINHDKRKAAIIMALFIGMIISFIGSLTFLVGKQFPKEFSEFAGISVNNETADIMGDFLGWTNVIVEAIFYTWTISGILSSIHPEEDNAIVSDNHKHPRCRTKFIYYLPSIVEWSLAIASTIPLTFLSLIDEEKTEKDDIFKYGIVSSIALITLISNKYFLTLTHKQFKDIFNWFRNKNKPTDVEQNLLKQVKKAFLETVIHSNEQLYHLSKEEFRTVINSLNNLVQCPVDLINREIDDRSKILLSIVFMDLSSAPKKTYKSAIILIPAMAIEYSDRNERSFQYAVER